MIGTEEKTEIEMEEFIERELPLLLSILTFNSEHMSSIYADSTVVKSPEVAIRGTMFSDEARVLGEEYLNNFKYPERSLSGLLGVSRFEQTNAVLSLSQRDAKHRWTDEEKVELPEEKSIRVPLDGVIRSRRSVRQFAGRSMSLQDLATLLYYTQGVSGSATVQGIPESEVFGEEQTQEFRTAPSGGGLYPVTTYVAALDVDGLEPAIYQYSPSDHELKRCREIEPDDVHDVAPFDTFDMGIDDANVLVGFEYNLFRNARKYGRSAVLFGGVEVGAIAENLHLAAIGLGYGSCDLGGYDKVGLEEFLGLEHVGGHAIHSIVVGHRE